MPKINFERKKMMSKAASAITDAMDKVTSDVGELYYSEWIKVLQDAQSRLIGELVMDDQNEDNEAD